MNSFDNKRGYRSQRIERAAADILECEILPSFNDPELEGLHVYSVQAAGGLSCLHVLVAPGSVAALKDAEIVEAALARVEGRVRSELAASLRIKRMPVVRLRYVPLPMDSGARAETEDTRHETRDLRQEVDDDSECSSLTAHVSRLKSDKEGGIE